MKTANYNTDWDFHIDVASLFWKLRDAHTAYFVPECYKSFTFYQPLPLISFVDESNLQIIAVSSYINPTLAQHWLEQGIDLHQFSGATVMHIGNMDAMNYMVQYAREDIGVTKDLATRFDLALRIPTPFDGFQDRGSMGWFSGRSLKFGPFPLQSSLNYTLQFKNGTVLRINFPWIAQPGASYADTLAFQSACRASANVSRTPLVANVEPIGPKPSSHPRSPKRSNITPLVNCTSCGVGLYQIDAKTMVLYINTFEPSDEAAFLATIEKGLAIGSSLGLTNVILDLSQNGGGDICLGRQVLRLLFPDRINWGPTDVPQSPLALNLTLSAVALNNSNTFWSPTVYLDEDGNPFPNSESWLVPGISRFRGGVVQTFSQLIHIGTGCGDINQTNPNPYVPKNMLIMTRGFCGSTCALFANHLRNYEGVRTVVVGGLKGRPQGYTSFPGLQVLDSPDFYDELDSLDQNTSDQSCTTCLAPRRLLTSAAFRMCTREIYGPDDFDLPLEYRFLQADFQLETSRATAEYPELIWEQLLQFFQ
eukprot:TRINITY_DN3091_c0_g1_i3.p1 TRINITY_DN3091_c0_g1~~TRINITY_DN3091_c0_g1_i3.p1  ORF type:complete len:629 (+),score=164.53 TRINITY_DN3091_c0_g1_i3:284-1888(+)